jgi:HSP20 family protein
MKAVTLYRPRVLENVLSDFDHYMGSLFGDNIFGGSKAFQHQPSIDVRETEKSYLFEAELPGFDEKDIEVHLDGNTLTIASRQEEERKTQEQGSGEDTDKTTSDGNYLIRERRLSSFSRSFKLPANADPEGISAAFKNGVLALEISKRPEAQKRLIQVSKG